MSTLAFFFGMCIGAAALSVVSLALDTMHTPSVEDLIDSAWEKQK